MVLIAKISIKRVSKCSTRTRARTRTRTRTTNRTAARTTARTTTRNATWITIATKTNIDEKHN